MAFWVGKLSGFSRNGLRVSLIVSVIPGARSSKIPKVRTGGRRDGNGLQLAKVTFNLGNVFKLYGCDLEKCSAFIIP